MERIHTHGEQLLRPLKLTAGEGEDLVAFLGTLSDPAVGVGPTPLPLPATCGR